MTGAYAPLAGNAQGVADQRVADKAAAHAQSVRDVGFYMAASSLLLNPGPPPLFDLLVNRRPDRTLQPHLFDAEGRFVIPQPGGQAWTEFYDWMTRPENEKLIGAINHIMGVIEFGPGSTG
jgi:hypothetical protein